MDHVYPSQLGLGRNQSPRAKEVLGEKSPGIYSHGSCLFKHRPSLSRSFDSSR